MTISDLESERKLTDAQKRALEWLPDDGSWRNKAGRLSAALNSLGLYHRDIVQRSEKWGWVEWRLTPYGVDVKRRLTGAAP